MNDPDWREMFKKLADIGGAWCLRRLEWSDEDWPAVEAVCREMYPHYEEGS